VQDTIDALNERIAELEAAIESMKAGNLLTELNAQLGIDYCVARCRFTFGKFEFKTFAEALECARHCQRDILPGE